MFVDGYKYWLIFKKNDRSYFRCRRHRKGCPAKFWTNNAATAATGSTTTTTTTIPTPTLKADHNHPRETERGLVDSFRRVLTRRAATEKLDLHTIYYDEARHSGEAALIYTFSTAESAMSKARRKANCTLPDTTDFREIAEILRTTQNFAVVCCGKRDPFFEEAYTRNGTVNALVFAHQPTVSRLASNGLDEVQVNVISLSSNNSPSSSSSSSSVNYYLLTIHHLDRTARITPLVYVLLDGKTPDGAVFAHFREKLKILPAVVISDCLHDRSLQDSLLMTFPEASIKANWFEYVGSVSKFVAESESREMFKEVTNQIILRMLLVLPFLPADYMAPGLEAIRKWMSDKGVDLATGTLASLCRHIESAWLRSIGAGKLSLFRVTISVEDHMKEFQKEVLLGSATPRHKGDRDNAASSAVSVWDVIKSLSTIAAKVNNRLTRTTPLPSCREKVNAARKSQILSEAIIRNATEQWITQPIHLRSPLQFLQMASHFITPPFLSAVLRQSFFETHEELPEAVVAEKNCEVMVPIPTNTYEAQNCVQRSQAEEAGVAINPPGKSSEPPPLAFFPRVIARAVLPKDPPPLMPFQWKK